MRNFVLSIAADRLTFFADARIKVQVGVTSALPVRY
jgi:hypothetical protein